MRSDIANLAAAGASGSGAAVDTSEFSSAVAEAEERMRNHVDEAVVALAEMLLRRRMPAPSFDPIDAPSISPARPVIPSLPAEEPAAAAYDDTAPAYEVAASAEAEPIGEIDDPDADDDLGPDSPEWWERDDLTAIPTLPAADQPDDELPMVDFSVASIDDEDSDDDAVGGLVDGPPAEPAQAYEPEPAGEEAEDLDATSEIAVIPDEAPPPPPTSYPPPTSTWSPEVPTPDRPEADPVGTVVPERKKRWFRG